MINEAENSNPLSRYVDLAQPRLGSTVVYATDDFFADKATIDPSGGEPIFVPDKYDDERQVDGTAGKAGASAYAGPRLLRIVKLGVPGLIKGFDIDTSHFDRKLPASRRHRRLRQR